MAGTRSRTAITLILLLTGGWALPSPTIAGGNDEPAPTVGHAGGEGLPTVERVLERYVSALGGRAAIERLETRIVTGRVIDDLPSRTPPVYEVGSFEFYSDASGNYGFTIRWENGTATEGWDGEVGWRRNQRGLKREDAIGRSKFAWLLHPRGALNMDDYFPALSVSKRQIWYGHEVYVVETGLPDYPLYFDVKTGLLVGVGYHRELSDYREVDGVMFPFRIVLGRKGGASTFRVETIRHDEPIDPRRFSMPAGEPVAAVID